MNRSKEGDLRRSQTAIKIIMLELGFGLLYGCSASAAASEIDLPPPTQPKPEETTPVPPNWIAPTTVFDAAENPFPTQTQTLTLTSTPPTEVGFDPTCFPETVRAEIEANFPANQTLVPLSKGKFREAIGPETPPAVVTEVLRDATNRISALAGYYAKYPEFGINRIVVPADIEPADIKNAIAEIEPAAGSNLTVVEYVTGMDLSGPETALTAIHVGVNGGNWEVFAWTNGGSVGTRLRVDQRSDGTWRVGGLIHIWTITKDGRLVLAEVPEQLVDGRPDVAIVDGCNPIIVKIGDDGEVTEIFKEGISFITPDNKVDKGAVVWKKAQAGAEAEPTATKTPTLRPIETAIPILPPPLANFAQKNEVKIVTRNDYFTGFLPFSTENRQVTSIKIYETNGEYEFAITTLTGDQIQANLDQLTRHPETNRWQIIDENNQVLAVLRPEVKQWVAPLQLPETDDYISVGHEAGFTILTLFPYYTGVHYQTEITVNNQLITLTVIEAEILYPDNTRQTVNILAGITDADGREWKTIGFKEGRNGDRTLLSGSEVVAKLKPGDRLELGGANNQIPPDPSVQKRSGVPEEGMRLVLNDIIKSFWDEAKSQLETTETIPDGLIFRAGKFIRLHKNLIDTP